MARGRKRKLGKREKNGRIQRTPEIRYDKGTERAQAMQALYGPDGADAIGRAFRAGLLGEGSDAKAMLDMARSIANAYWQAYEVGPYSSTLADRSSGSTASILPDKARRREKWLSGCLDTVKALGASQRRSFYQLVIDVNPDHGPLWLDRLCFAHRCKTMMADPGDVKCLELALEGLALLANVGCRDQPLQR